MNVHTPERQPHETRAEYRKRQAESRAINDRLRLRGEWNIAPVRQFGSDPKTKSLLAAVIQSFFRRSA